jgi:hypothetical protein
MRLLGCVVGADDISIAEALNRDRRFRADQLAAFRRIRHLRKQAGMLALQHLTGVVITNRLRAMSPAATLQHATAYDAAVMSAAHSIVGITAVDGDKYDQQLQMPLSLGGFGLTSAVSISPAAYISGAENALRLSPAFADTWNDNCPLSPTCGHFIAINDSLTRIAAMDLALSSRGERTAVSKVSASILPANAATFVSHFRTMPPCLIQSAITHRIMTLIFIARVTEAGRAGAGGVEEVARLYALTAAESSLWLRTLPTEDGLRLTDTKWQWAARLRLGMCVPTVDTECRGCDKNDAHTGDSWHSLTCLQLSGRPITDRHNKVLNVLARFCSLMQVLARTEPAALCHDSNKRPDIQIDLPARTLLSDVTISHPSTKSWRTVAAKRGVEAVGDEREVEKNTNYSVMAQAIDMEFIPFVLYTYGGFHSSALKVIQRMAESLDPACCLLSRAEWKRMLMQHIAIAVQRGNADIMIQASQRSREALLGRPARTRRPKRSQPIGSDRSSHAASVVSAGPLSPLRATECGAAGSVSDVCQPAETPVPARVIATAVDTAVSTPVVGGAGCAVRADSSASFIALRDVSNSVGSDAVTVMLEWCESPCVSISRTDCGNMGDIVLDNAAAPAAAAPLSPSL